LRKSFFAAGLDRAALAHTQLFGEFGAQRIGGDVVCLHQPLLAIAGIGDNDRRPPRGALGIQLLEGFEFHG